MKEIQLTQGKVALVDDEDYDKINQYKWFAMCDYKMPDAWYAYTCRTKTKKRTSMHRLIMGLKSFKEDPVYVDHINHNGLDNRKENLRLAVAGQNQGNQRANKAEKYLSAYKGVTICNDKYQAYINFKGQRFHLGTFSIEKEAAIAYDNKARELFGEFACLNFPEINRKEKDRYTPKSIYRGVSSCKNGKYTARLKFRVNPIYIGVFSTAEEAAKAYDIKAKEILGANAKLNFPKEYTND